MTYTNVSIYEKIVYESFSDMNSILEEGRTPKEDGRDGYIIKYDPSQRSFKQSMIVVVFAGMWLEAKFHLEMVRKYSKNQFQKHNRKSYKEKLELIGISETSILDKAALFQKTRNELIHEKAFIDKGEIKTAQNEAKTAHEIVQFVSNKISNDG